MTTEKGFVTKVERGDVSHNGKPTPGKVFLTLEDGTNILLLIWPNFGTSDYPNVVHGGGSLESLLYKNVLAETKGGPSTDTVTGIESYKLASIKSLGDGEMPAPKHNPATPATPKPASEESYAPQTRQEQGLALGNSKTVASNVVSAFVTATSGELPSEEWLKNAAGCVNTFSRYLLTNIEVELFAERDERKPIGVLSADGEE